MENLKNYSENELSLRVFNDEYFYNERRNSPFLMALIKEQFIYTGRQLEVLLDDLKEDHCEDDETIEDLMN